MRFVLDAPPAGGAAVPARDWSALSRRFSPGCNPGTQAVAEGDARHEVERCLLGAGSRAVRAAVLDAADGLPKTACRRECVGGLATQGTARIWERCALTRCLFSGFELDPKRVWSSDQDGAVLASNETWRKIMAAAARSQLGLFWLA